MDASHRGGPPGFVAVRGDTLRIPDYAGNSMFNTFGNLLGHPLVGLGFPAFDGGGWLQVGGRAGCCSTSPTPTAAPAAPAASGRSTPSGSGRGRARTPAGRRRWEFLDASPFLPVVKGAG